jgi:hypothetical protein
MLVYLHRNKNKQIYHKHLISIRLLMSQIQITKIKKNWMSIYLTVLHLIRQMTEKLHDMTPNGMLWDVCVSRKKINRKRYNKHLILIRTLENNYCKKCSAKIWLQLMVMCRINKQKHNFIFYFTFILLTMYIAHI